MVEFLKLYLSMEAWLLDVNTKSEVHNSRAFIGHVIQMLQDLFPRGDQGWNLPNIHGLTQFQLFVTLFGSANNFNTDTGESNHRWLVKDTVSITQKKGKTSLWVKLLTIVIRHYRLNSHSPH